jgi:hypothetical protein
MNLEKDLKNICNPVILEQTRKFDWGYLPFQLQGLGTLGRLA